MTKTARTRRRRTPSSGSCGRPSSQQVFADNGYRPVVKSVENANRKKFPVRPGLFTIDQLGLGGWEKVQKRFFDPKSGIMARFQRQVGGSTG